MNDLWSKVRDFVGFSEPDDSLDGFDGIADDDEFDLAYEGRGRRANQHTSAIGSGDGDESTADYTQTSSIGDRSWRSSSEERRRSGDITEAAGRDRRTQRSGGSSGGNTMNNVIGLPNVNQVTNEVVVVEPRSFDEMAQVIQSLRDRKTVIMNLTLMDPGDAQRSVDFVAGGTYAIDGHQERIGENIFLFTPNCVSVSTPSTTPVQIPMQPVQTPTPIWSVGFSETAQASGQR